MSCFSFTQKLSGMVCHSHKIIRAHSYPGWWPLEYFFPLSLPLEIHPTELESRPRTSMMSFLVITTLREHYLCCDSIASLLDLSSIMQHICALLPVRWHFKRVRWLGKQQGALTPLPVLFLGSSILSDHRILCLLMLSGMRLAFEVMQIISCPGAYAILLFSSQITKITILQPIK